MLRLVFLFTVLSKDRNIRNTVDSKEDWPSSENLMRFSIKKGLAGNVPHTFPHHLLHGNCCHFWKTPSCSSLRICSQGQPQSGP